LDAFRYGGLLFSGYAQRIGADHVLQPKRAKLYLASSLAAQRLDDEKALYAELMKLADEAPRAYSVQVTCPQHQQSYPTSLSLTTRHLKDFSSVRWSYVSRLLSMSIGDGGETFLRTLVKVGSSLSVERRLLRLRKNSQRAKVRECEQRQDHCEC